MKLPVWSFELQRSTNAPFERVVERLLDGEHYHDWHPRHRHITPRLVVNETDHVEVEYRDKPLLGVEECSRYVVRRQGEQAILLHIGKFKGFPVLFLMPYWHLRSANLWERFVETL